MLLGKIQNLITKKLHVNFEIDQEILERFCSENKKIWQKSSQDAEKEGSIFIGLFMVEKWVAWLEPKILYAKGIEQSTGYKPIVIDWEYNEELVKLYDSYGMGYISLKKEMFINPLGLLYGAYRALAFYLTGASGHKLANLRYQGIELGHFMYDTIIRTNQEIYTVRDTKTKICAKKVITGFWTLHTLNRLCKKYQPKHYLFDDLVYDEGMIVTFLKNQGVHISGYDCFGYYYEPRFESGMIYWPDYERSLLIDKLDSLTEEQQEEYITAADQLLDDRFHARNGVVRDSKAAFVGKKEATREELGKIMGLHPDRKNVVICCHTLSESAHRCSKQVFEDTFTWVEETMKIVRDMDNVNWIVKVHPIAALKYGEGGIVEGLYEKYKSDNLFLFPDEYNSALVGTLADTVITIYGTVGCEYSCLGIPVVLAGKAVYSEFGYTIDAYDLEKYKEVLRTIENIQPLTEEQKRQAKQVFTYQNRKKDIIRDAFMQKLVDFIWKLDTDYMAGESLKRLNSETLCYMMDEVSKDTLCNTIYYQTGCKVGNK